MRSLPTLMRIHTYLPWITLLPITRLNHISLKHLLSTAFHPWEHTNYMHMCSSSEAALHQKEEIKIIIISPPIIIISFPLPQTLSLITQSTEQLTHGSFNSLHAFTCPYFPHAKHFNFDIQFPSKRNGHRNRNRKKKTIMVTIIIPRNFTRLPCIW